MKLLSSLHIIRLLTLLTFLTIITSSLLAQLREDLRNELLVYIKPTELEFPVYDQGSIPLEKLTIYNSELRSVFSQFGVRELQKAFPNITDADTVAIDDDGEILRLPQVSRIFIVRIDNVNDIDSAIANLSRIPGVLFAEKHSEMSLTDDDLYPYQWHLNNTGQTFGTPDADIDAPEAWQIFSGSSSIKLGVIDTGVEIIHDDLNGKSSGDLPENYPFDGYAHGTHVAGISAAIHNNVGQVRGVDANVQVRSKKVFSGWYYDPSCNCDRPAWAGDNNAYNKIVQAINEGSHVFNNSYGGPNFSTTLRLAFAYAYKMNRTAVVSMGNWNGNQTQYPAGFGQGIIAVGSTDHNDQIAIYSNTGNHIDVTAPGSSILSTWRTNDYGLATGTSMAAPVVSGIASLLKGYNPNLYNDDIEQIIRISTDDKGPLGWDPEYGTGRVNAFKALQFLQAPYQLSQLSASGGQDYSVTDYYNMQIWGAPGLADGNYIVKRHEVRKNVTFSAVYDHYVWGRGVGSTGWIIANPNFTMGFCEIIPGTLTSTSATLRTYVYQVWNVVEYLGYYPSTPQNATFKYTVLGKPIVAPIIDHFVQNPKLTFC